MWAPNLFKNYYTLYIDVRAINRNGAKRETISYLKNNIFSPHISAIISMAYIIETSSDIDIIDFLISINPRANKRAVNSMDFTRELI